MFLAQVIYSFSFSLRPLCPKTVVTDFVLAGTSGEEERGEGGGVVG